MAAPGRDKKNNKPYVWLHPPKDEEISIHDSLFVLCDKNPRDYMSEYRR